MKVKLLNTTPDGTAPTLTVRYAQGFALSSSLIKNKDFGLGGGIQGLQYLKCMKIILTNTTPDGCAFALTTSLPDHAGLTNLVNGGGHYPSTGVMEIYEADTERPEEEFREG